MPPKKKQKTATPQASSKPSSTRSTRSRSTSHAPPSTTTPSTSKKSKKPRTVKAEPLDPELDLTLKDYEDLQAWDGKQRQPVECWVEIPAPEYRTREDELLFVRPKDKEALRAKGKHKEYSGSFVWHVEQESVDADPFHYTKEDLDRGSGVDAKRVVAVRPKAKTHSSTTANTKGSAQIRKSKSRSASVQPAKVAETSSSESAPAPAATVTSGSRQQVGEEAPVEEVADDVVADDGGLEDLFLGSTRGAGTEGPDPLFFEGGASDEEDRMRNGTPIKATPRQRIKQSPTLGDRIAKPSSTQARAPRSRSSTPQPAKPTTRPAIKSQELTEQARKKRKQEQKEKRKREQLELEEKARKQRRAKKEIRERKQDTDDDDDDDSKPHDDLKNLRSELNEDAFARSTGARHKEEYRNKLAKFAQARRKARLEKGDSVSSSEEDEGPKRGKRVERVSSGSSSDSSSSGSSSSSSSSSDSEDFIVGDDQIEYDDGFQPEAPSPAPKTPARPSASQAATSGTRRSWDRDSDGRIRLVPISDLTSESSSGGSVLAAHGLGGVGARKGIDELCLDWLEWAVARVLVTWSALSAPDRERLERGRAALKSKMRSIEESVGSVAMRRQFKWYLTQYPKIELEGLFSDELEQFGTLAKQGCGVCHRRSQKPAFKVTFGGLRYNQQALAPLKQDTPSDPDNSESSSDSDSEDAESDRSSQTETWREEGEDSRARPTYTFFAGNHCAQRAAVLHKLHHWGWATMQTLAKHDSIRFVRRLLWRKGKDGRGKDGRLGAGAWEVAFCVREMVSPTGRANWKGKAKAKGDGRELDRLRRRLRTLQGMAIDVNRAR